MHIHFHHALALLYSALPKWDPIVEPPAASVGERGIVGYDALTGLMYLTHATLTLLDPLFTINQFFLFFVLIVFIYVTWNFCPSFVVFHRVVSFLWPNPCLVTLYFYRVLFASIAGMANNF